MRLGDFFSSPEALLNSLQQPSRLFQVIRKHTQRGREGACTAHTDRGGGAGGGRGRKGPSLPPVHPLPATA